MNAARFEITLADGRVVVGPVHGAGGVLNGDAGNLRRIEVAIERATRGDTRRRSLYEPRPGHARVYPDYCAASNGDPVDVNLAGARVRRYPTDI